MRQRRSLPSQTSAHPCSCPHAALATYVADAAVLTALLDLDAADLAFIATPLLILHQSSTVHDSIAPANSTIFAGSTAFTNHAVSCSAAAVE